MPAKRRGPSPAKVSYVLQGHLDRLRRITDEGDNALTPVVLAGIVLAFVVPLAALLIVLADGVAHFEGGLPSSQRSSPRRFAGL